PQPSAQGRGRAESVKHSLHRVNPLIAPHVNPFLPSTISTVSVLFFTLITVLV
ncbi:unnamed protein product, partial [Staurois parvus]